MFASPRIVCGANCENGQPQASAFPFASVCGPLRASPSRQRSGYGVEVGRQHSPAYPSAEPFLAFIPATAQIFPPLHDADAPLYAGPKPPRPLEPPLPLVLLALDALLARFGQAHLPYPHLFCCPFVLFGVHVAVRRHELWRSTEQAQVILERRPQLGFVTGIALQDPESAHDAPIHLREPHFPPELCALRAYLAPADYARVFLEDGNQFFFGRNPLPLEHSPAGLRNDSLEKLREVGEPFGELPC